LMGESRERGKGRERFGGAGRQRVQLISARV